MGLKGRQITDFQLKIRDPWRYKVWPHAYRPVPLFLFPGMEFNVIFDKYRPQSIDNYDQLKLSTETISLAAENHFGNYRYPGTR